eukprot:2379836-Rhodomonas_salina.1
MEGQSQPVLASQRRGCLSLCRWGGQASSRSLLEGSELSYVSDEESQPRLMPCAKTSSWKCLYITEFRSRDSVEPESPHWKGGGSNVCWDVEDV